MGGQVPSDGFSVRPADLLLQGVSLAEAAQFSFQLFDPRLQGGYLAPVCPGTWPKLIS